MFDRDYWIREVEIFRSTFPSLTPLEAENALKGLMLLSRSVLKSHPNLQIQVKLDTKECLILAVTIFGPEWVSLHCRNLMSHPDIG